MRDRAAGPTDGGRFADDDTPSNARVYDYLLGGKDNFAIDRQASDILTASVPGLPVLIRDARNFLRRVVPWLVREAGIRQFIDLGSGLPTVGNVHEIAQSVAPDARVLYTDNDPKAVAYGRALLSDEATTRFVDADIRDPDAIFDHPETKALIDFERPVAVLGTAVFHLLTDDEVYPATERIRERLRPGSHVVYDDLLDDVYPDAKGFEDAGGAVFPTVRVRTWPEFRRFFDGLEIVEPGLVYVNDWRPERPRLVTNPTDTLGAVGVARMPD